MLALMDWLDRDDVTDEDLCLLDAEDEVRDWMDRTPSPPPPRPDYIDEEEVTEIRPRRRRRISKDPANPSVNWSLVAGSAMMGLVFTMSMMASAVGVVVATLT